VKVDVDPDKCEGWGRCEQIAPQVFKVPEDGGVVEILMKGDIPEELEGAVIRAVERCPRVALFLDVDLDADPDEEPTQNP
jgi:ferredoxin